ncbi:Uu.00g023190.m01.CDS01 [Anthostomella pinea]|uniref:Uu.00g023190.m01.CDS01 n=1 Tax=Anthostomella pinea TaxID=933095 RepID=A0AAI8W0I9_9PEZI|nr:Uu.00g023190.m01.CDS01 [Anthostomella pinea]
MGSSHPHSRRSRPWPLSGWRLAAVVNTALVFLFTVFITALLIWSSARSGGTSTNTMFFTGDCAKSRTMNFWLHLLLNVFSTGVLASSSFFCQTLSSPSRSEVDASHAREQPMSIGVPSVRNLFKVQRFKGISWALFFLSSIPLHLFFNSAIFQTEYQGGHWNLALASEAFAEGAQYFNPGAILMPTGSSYGDRIPYEDYFDSESEISKQITSTASSVGKWKRIEVPECRSQYEYCNARTKYGDVVMVVKSQDPDRFMFHDTSSLGWTRDSVIGPLDNLDEKYWDPHVPANESNSLWFFANCNTTADLSPQTHQAEGCFSTCNEAYGRKEFGNGYLSADQIDPTYNFDFITDRLSDIAQANEHWPGLADPSASQLELEYCLVQEMEPVCKVGLSNELLLVVVICLIIKSSLCLMVTIVLPRDEPLVVPGDAIVSFMNRPDVRTVYNCNLDRSLWKRETESDDESKLDRHRPRQWHLEEPRRWRRAIPISAWLRSYFLFGAVIVFLGFMFGIAQKTNPYNDGSQSIAHSATNGILNIRGSGGGDLIRSVLTANLPQLLLSFSYYAYNSLYTMLCVEKEWNAYSTDYRPLRVTSPKGQQVSAYRLQLPYRYSIPLIVISALLHFLVSNTLYVFILEGGYYMINAPISYSDQGSVPSPVPGSGLSDDAFIGIGYSTVAILIVLIVYNVLALIPLVLCWFRMKGPMVLGGFNSLVISAACHFSPVPAEALGTTASASASAAPATARKPRRGTSFRRPQKPAPAPVPDAITQIPAQDGTMVYYQEGALPSYAGPLEMQICLDADTSYEAGVSRSHLKKKIIPDETEADELEINGDAVVDVSRGLVRWGALKVPLRERDGLNALGGDVGHIGFGSEGHEVETPIEGHWYM